MKKATSGLKKAGVMNVKFLLCLGFLAVVACTAVFASTDSSSTDAFGVTSHMNTLLGFISSPWVKGIACIALVAECIGLITAGRQEPGMFKKFVPWIAGTIIFMAASTITGKFMSGADGSWTVSGITTTSTN